MPPGARLGSGEGDQAEEGGRRGGEEERLVHALHSLRSRRAPARRARATARGPLSGGLSVRRRGPGTRSAAERRGAGYKPLGFRRVYFAPWELHQIWRSEKELCLICRYDRRLPESCFLCHFLWRPVFAICGFFLLLVSTLQGGGNIQS
ncbi:hypothetical protein AB1E18_013201 [Capra hircus]